MRTRSCVHNLLLAASNRQISAATLDAGSVHLGQLPGTDMREPRWYK